MPKFKNGVQTNTLRVDTTATAGRVLTADTSGNATWQSKGGKGFINHGAVAGTARPIGWDSVEWHGTVQPTNGVIGDTWVNTT